jgi:hypothetical protein
MQFLTRQFLTRWTPFIISLILTPVAFSIGSISVGAGEGNAVLAKILFPYMFLGFAVRSLISDEVAIIIGTFLFLISLIQYPVYGLVLSLLDNKTATVFLLFVIHLTAYIVTVRASGWGFF